MNSIKITRTYDNFGGVDFLNEKSLVTPQRSPDALNIWKDYSSTLGICIETRPGARKIASFGSKINGIYVWSRTIAIVHSGTNLYEWNNFPDYPHQANIKVLSQSMNNKRTNFNRFGEYLYINDGENYLFYDGTEVKNVSEIAYIPTTTIGRKPLGGGERLEDVNVLQPKRINAFVADSTSTTFVLDSDNIDEEDVKVIVNDQVVSNYTVNYIAGSITFNTAPPAPTISGQDNVFIEFSKTILRYATRISKCTKVINWDNRLFYTGNPDYPNALFHSELNNPAYISDLSYYEDGSSDSPIMDICIGSNVLWVFKNNDQNNSNVFYHEAQIDNEQGAIYPRKQGNVETGCISKAINFSDDIVYLSNKGLEGITTENIESRQAIAHRSSLIDSKMINDTNYNDAMMCVFQGYLLILIENKIFLGDSRQKYSSLNSFEYEWYYWRLDSVNPSLIKDYDGSLYIGSNIGDIYIMEGTNDDGEIINSYWTTPLDNFNYANLRKTTNKRGGIIRIKTIPNGRVKIARKTNKRNDYEKITEVSANGFTFNNIDFSNFSFVTGSQSYVVIKVKEKKFNEFSFKFYSDDLDKPFGIISAIEEAFVGGYIKR